MTGLKITKLHDGIKIEADQTSGICIAFEQYNRPFSLLFFTIMLFRIESNYGLSNGYTQTYCYWIVSKK